VASSGVVTPAVPALLAAAVGAGVLAGCTSPTGPGPAPSASGARDTDPDTAAIEAARLRELALLAAYDDPVTASSGLSAAADEARVHHVLHLRALDALMATVGAPLAAATSAGAVAPVASTGPPGTPAVPTDAVAVARRLLAAERAAADAGLIAVGDVTGPVLRRLLAEVAASEAQHATALYLGLREGIIRRAP